MNLTRPLLARQVRFVIVPFLTVLMGCAQPSDTSSPGKAAISTSTQPPLNVIALDRSGSTQHMRANQISAFRAAFSRAAKWGEDVAVYTIDRKTACVMAPITLTRGKQPPASVLKELETPPPDRATKTRPALFWEQMVKDYSNAPNERTVRILYLTDGGNDWLDEDARVSKAVQQLATSTRVQIALLGINKDLYQPISDQFKAFGPDRLVISVGGDRETMIQGIATWREKGEQ